eukprot:g10067.t1
MATDGRLPQGGMKTFTSTRGGQLEVALNLHHQPWAGREWFVVKKAQVQMAEDKTLIPLVKMGVEAREQVLTANGLQDTPITSASHPLRRFADAFTRNFDLIAERKSVIFHLRELAKASVMAKFLVDSGACLDELWKTIGEDSEHQR